MGFNTVYRFLSEIFPQVDARLLKAVAIEHSKDADAAANVILTEILPYCAKQSMTSVCLPENQSASTSTLKEQSASSSPSKDQSLRYLSDGDGEHEEQSSLSRHRGIVKIRSKDAGTSSEPRAITNENATNTDSTHANYADSASLFESLDLSTNLHFYDANDGSGQLFGNNESEEVILFGKREESSNEVGSNNVSIVMPNTVMNVDGIIVDLPDGCAYTESRVSVSSDKGQDINVKVGPEQNSLVVATPLTHENVSVNGSLTDRKHFDGSLPMDDTSVCGKDQQEESSLECPLVVVENPTAQLVPSSIQEQAANDLESDLQSEISSGTSTTDCKKPDADDTSDVKSDKENSSSEMGAIEDELTVTNVISRSGQICRIDLLEEIIENAKNNKKTLFLAMQSVMNMMREVELQEKAAEEAKIEAARGGLEILDKVEELKSMLAFAKAANDMHAGEIYGEKAILATEARELQSRLLSLSEERDKSLAILDEMRETLQGRLAVAEEVRKVAEEEKLGKEASARNSMAELEAMMEKVVQESKILQQEAEKNSKLREFLMDRGRVVDSLQGEISVICQDVRLLKEKFDERVPLSKSVSSSQTTCILASSGSSSVKSLASLAAEQVLTSERTFDGTSPSPSIHVQSPKSSLEDEQTGADHRELLDDGWDFFDKDTELYGRTL